MPIPDRHPGGITIDVAGADRMALNLRVKIKKARVRVNVSRAPLLVTIMLMLLVQQTLQCVYLGFYLSSSRARFFCFSAFLV
jgi:hypothetical protein